MVSERPSHRLLDRVTHFEPGGGPWRRGYLRAELDITPIGRPEAARRWPSLRLPVGLEVLFEADAGALRPEACCRALVAAARQAGAVALEGVTVHAIEASREGFRLSTSLVTSI